VVEAGAGQHFNLYLLTVVVGVLLAGVLASLLKPARPQPALELSRDRLLPAQSRPTPCFRTRSSA